MAHAEDHPIIEFWFGELDADGNASPEHQKRWWTKDSAFDELCRERFEAELIAAREGERDELRNSPRGCLALILLFDQISRNIYRDAPGAFATDDKALELTRHLIESGGIDELVPTEKSFALMPLMHSEDREVQKLSVERFAMLAEEGAGSVDFAERHKVIIDRFGRYPHRNAILGRESTPEEVEFLTQPGSSF